MSEKVKDDKNRWRNKIVAFRMSPEESEELDKRYRLLGYRTKQNYLIDAVLHNQVTAMGNMQMILEFRKSLEEIMHELQRLQTADDMDEELMTPIRTMLEIMEAVWEQKEASKGENKMSEEQYGQMMHLRKLQELLLKERNKDAAQGGKDE